MTNSVETFPNREMYIAYRIYVDDETYAETGRTLGLSKERVRQIYARFARKCRQARYEMRTRGCLSSRYHPDVSGSNFLFLDETLIPMSEELVRYNLEQSKSTRNECFERTTTEGDLKITVWTSPTHLLTMFRRTERADGQVSWECNAHFYNQCVKYPKRQSGRSGIYTKLP